MRHDSATDSTTPLVPRTWWIAGIALLGLRLLVLVASVPAHAPLTGDESTYSDVARSVLAGEGYARGGQPWVLRPPGWPLTLAAIYGAFGSARRTVVLWQGLFDTGTVLAYAWLAGQIFRTRAAIALTFLISALWPPFFRESRFLQTEPLFTLSVAVLTCAFARFAVKPTPLAALCSGCAAGLAALVRPTGLLLFFGLVLGWLLRDSRPLRLRSVHLLILIAGLMLALAPWTLRNARVFGRFIPVSTGGGEMFYTGTTLETDGRWNHRIFVALATEVLVRERMRVGHPLDPVERDRALLHAGLENWKRHPVRSAIIMLKRFYRLCFVPLASEHQPWLRVGFLATLLVLYGLALPQGMAGFASREGWPAFRATMLIALAVYVLVSSIFYTNSRYLEPVRALLVVLASGAAAGFLDRARTARGVYS